jgi:hypothetical protein
MVALVERKLAGGPKYSNKTRPSATLSTTNPTYSYMGLNSGSRRLTAWAIKFLVSYGIRKYILCIYLTWTHNYIGHSHITPVCCGILSL